MPRADHEAATAHPERWKVYRIQHLGGVLSGDLRFGVVAFPTTVGVGIPFGTPLSLPYFRARLTAMDYPG
jgi:hypothetical protein